VALIWAQLRRHTDPELRLRSRRDLLAVLLWIAIVGLLGWLLVRRANSSLLLLPLLAGPALVFGCFRLPPRWALAMSALFILEFAALAVSRQPPYTVADPYVRASLQQLLIGIFATVPFLLSVGITQLRIAMSRLAESERRYRTFVQLSHEAMWRMEVDPPMPVDLEPAEQLKWLRQHARVVERNRSYGRLSAEGKAEDSDRWWTGVPWGAEFEQRLVAAGRNDFNIQDMRFTVTRGGRTHTFLASVNAIVEQGRLQRLWGVARDVSELMELNAQLLREQERLRGYARQLVAAEERARRATAVDLHDGIGQTLAGMLMITGAARQQSSPVVQRMLDDLGLRLREIQELTRRMISDMSPPGLYDLGLAAALQWLAVNLHAEAGLVVELDCRFAEEHLRVETRVLVFRLVRELLRNVVKHAGVTNAKVTVEEADGQLRVEVGDEGRGFEWPMEMFGERGNGFGLWSVADRIRDVGGSFEVHAAVGRGARFRMVLPLSVADAPKAAQTAP
jgi:signal transduction histidine kinase